VVIGSFQRERWYRRSESRWRRLAEGAELALVLADFERPRCAPYRPSEVPVDRDDPLSREWTIAIDSPGFAACLAGWERPGDAPDPERTFEVVWATEREVVREATTLAIDLACARMPELRDRVPARLTGGERNEQPELRRATALTNRMLAYVAAGWGSSTAPKQASRPSISDRSRVAR
jgi:DICT domain-containing protein